jgi:hypothetical protein
MAKTVADQFAEVLATAGVKRIYGIVGDSLNGLTDALRRQGKIEWVHVRHEEVAAFAAGAEAHLTGELAVCAGSCGPGNLPNAAEQKATTHDGSVSDRDQHIGGRLDRVERSICTLSLSHDRQDMPERNPAA